MAQGGTAERLFDGLLPKSKMALSMAMAILEQPGMDGWVMVYIPSDDRRPCEVMTATHPWHLQLHPDGFDPGKKR